MYSASAIGGEIKPDSAIIPKALNSYSPASSGCPRARWASYPWAKEPDSTEIATFSHSAHSHGRPGHSEGMRVVGRIATGIDALGCAGERGMALRAVSPFNGGVVEACSPIVEERLVEEAERFSLRFACDHCAYFLEAPPRCAHGYPLGARADALREGREIEFCKEWEGA